MNAQNAREYMPLVQAVANGLTIQCNDRGEWVDVESLYTDVYGPDEYRIKPKPRTFDLWLDHDTGCLTTDELIRDFGHVRFDSLERITVQEVIK